MSRAQVGRKCFTTMFKNATIYTVKLPQPMLVKTLDDAMQAQAFAPIGASQELSYGWVPPRGHEHGPLVEHIGGQLIMRLMIESKTVPTQAIADKVAQEVKRIEAITGRKPGKKETRELKEDARLALLPNAFAKRAGVWVWIDPVAGVLVLDATGGRVDLVMNALVKSIPDVKFGLLNPNTSPAAAMAHWLRVREAPEHFSVDRACVLKSADETKAVVRYNRHTLDTYEVVQHVNQGKLPTQLALTWNERVSFTLTDGLQLRGIEFLEPVFEQNSASMHADRFDADVAIATGELGLLLPDLINALGGEVVTE